MPLPKIPNRPVLIAGPTASGKSGLAMEIADQYGGAIINADALQVYDGWRVLTARPSKQDEAAHPHHLYGHVPLDAPYSAGQWLRDVTEVLKGTERPIIVGGTGLYFAAITAGLAQIPATPPEIRAAADQIRQTGDIAEMISALDDATVASIDIQNPMRVQRAWEVLKTTGKSIVKWQKDTPAPLLDLADVTAIHVAPEIDWLNQRISQRFDLMLETGALDEATKIEPEFDPAHQSSKAIGAPELIAYVRGELSLEAARERATLATRQYAKRQRTWFRSKMKAWRRFNPTTGQWD